MQVLVNQDLVVGFAQGNVPYGLEAPVECHSLPAARLRVVDGKIVDAAALTTFFVDAEGNRHAVQSDASWQALACAWDDALILDRATGLWRRSTASDLPMPLARFRSRFTAAELVAIKTAGQTDAEVGVLEDTMAAWTTVVLSSAAVVTLVDQLVAKGLLTAERRGEILGA